MRRRADYLPNERCISVSARLYALIVRGLPRTSRGKIVPGRLKNRFDWLIRHALAREEGRP